MQKAQSKKRFSVRRFFLKHKVELPSTTDDLHPILDGSKSNDHESKGFHYLEDDESKTIVQDKSLVVSDQNVQLVEERTPLAPLNDLDAPDDGKLDQLDSSFKTTDHGVLEEFVIVKPDVDTINVTNFDLRQEFEAYFPESSLPYEEAHRSSEALAKFEASFKSLLENDTFESLVLEPIKEEEIGMIESCEIQANQGTDEPSESKGCVPAGDTKAIESVNCKLDASCTSFALFVDTHQASTGGSTPVVTTEGCLASVISSDLFVAAEVKVEDTVDTECKEDKEKDTQWQVLEWLYACCTQRRNREQSWVFSVVAVECALASCVMANSEEVEIKFIMACSLTLLAILTFILKYSLK